MLRQAGQRMQILQRLHDLPSLAGGDSRWTAGCCPEDASADACESSLQGLFAYGQQYRWASKKQGGSTQNGKDSNPKMLGVKLFGGQQCIPGNIIIRQRGTKFHPGAHVGLGKDHTIFATAAGKVKFEYHKLTKRRIVGVEL